MRIAHQYRLLPTKAQKAIINRWLMLLRHQYNRLLADRFDWYECNRSSVNACPLVCHLPELREQPNFYSQKRSLVQLKEEKPWYKEIHSQVLQNCVERVKLAFDRFLKRDFNGKKSYKKVAKLHQKIARQRKQFHFETARDLLKQVDVIFVEDLDIKNMSKRNKPKTIVRRLTADGDEKGKFLPNKQAQKSGMNKSFGDAGLGQFIEILMYKAENAGAKVIKVNPRGTSQHCSNCLNRLSKELSDRWHSCLCGCELDRDTNAAILIKKVGLGIASLKNARKSKLDKEKPAA